MWRVSYVVGVLIVGLGLFLAVGSVYGYTQLDADQTRAERLLAEAAGEEEMRWRQVYIAEIEDDKGSNVVVALGGLAMAVGGTALVVVTRRRRRVSVPS
ncbi:hypothetical protein [Catellatospora sp. NPDC049609]|uniref:hypothetical protein n=1 Tax=Catellatospora sp. NPDC049609 TaxID=3155505 RepID=UPI00344AD420